MNKFKVKSTQILIFNQGFLQPYDVYYILKIHNHRAFQSYIGIKCWWKIMQILHSGTTFFPLPQMRGICNKRGSIKLWTSAAAHCWTSAAVHVYHMWRFNICWRASVPPYKMSFLKTSCFSTMWKQVWKIVFWCMQVFIKLTSDTFKIL